MAPVRKTIVWKKGGMEAHKLKGKPNVRLVPSKKSKIARAQAGSGKKLRLAEKKPKPSVENQSVANQQKHRYQKMHEQLMEAIGNGGKNRVLLVVEEALGIALLKENFGQKELRVWLKQYVESHTLYSKEIGNLVEMRDGKRVLTGGGKAWCELTVNEYIGKANLEHAKELRLREG